MKTTIAALSLGLMTSALAFTSQGAIVAGWDFQSGTMLPSQGSGTLTTIANFGEAVGVGSPGNPSPALVFSPGATGGSFTIQINGTGLSGFSVTYDGLGGNPGMSQAWTYSTDGSTFTPLGGSSPSTLSGSFQTYNADFSAVAGLNGQSAVYFRDSIGNDAAFDNISVSAVPEPINVALVVFGVCVGGLSVGRRVYGRVWGGACVP